MFKLVSTESSNICFFFLFQNKDSLVPQTPSRTGIVIGPSRTGIVIGRSPVKCTAASYECARLRGGINYLYFGHRHAVGKLHNTSNLTFCHN